MKTTAKFASNSTASIKLSKHLSVFSLDFEEVLYEKQKNSFEHRTPGLAIQHLNHWFIEVNP